MSLSIFVCEVRMVSLLEVVVRIREDVFQARREPAKGSAYLVMGETPQLTPSQQPKAGGETVLSTPPGRSDIAQAFPRRPRRCI